MKRKSFFLRSGRRVPLLALAVLIIATGLLVISYEGSAQRRTRSFSSNTVTTKKARTSERKKNASAGSSLRALPQEIGDETKGVRLQGEVGVQRTTTEIMDAQAVAPPKTLKPLKREHDIPNREERPQHPDAQPLTSTPEQDLKGTQVVNAPPVMLVSQTLSTNFTGATLTDTGAFPPDSMGTAGPTQFIVFVNGRIRTFTKAGVADGVINADPDVFFAPVMTPVSPPVVLNFTSDPQIRYDRFTARWYMSIIDVPCTNATCTTTAPNRWLLAVSDAASNGTISGSTVWTLFQFQTDVANFCDYPSLGTDVNALYVGCNMFTGAGAFVGTNGYVVRKSTILGAGPMTVTAFANMALGAGAGPESPRGVDNFDPAATEGYFVGPDNAVFGAITFRRVSSPGSAAPTISANIVVAVSTTTSPNRVPHLGNTGGANGQLDSIDDRFFQAMIRGGRMWAAHNFRVNTTGVASTTGQNRNATRWYEFQNLTTTPTVVQSGTVYDNAALAANARQYFIPSVVVTGQGHAVMGMTMAGSPVGATPVFVGRLSGDTLGTMSGPPTVAAVDFGTTTANYNPPSDPGGAGGRRWGDYSFSVVDPLDDMTVWSIQEFNQALNSYAVRVGRILAPLPATPSSVTSANANTVPKGRPNYFITLTGTSASGSGFYDPGTNLAPPALPFNHVAVTVNGAGAPTVNSIIYVNPTTLTVALNSSAATVGSYTVTVTNPDAQTATSASAIVVVSAPTAAPATVSGSVVASDGTPLPGVTMQLSGNQSGTTITDSKGEYRFLNVDTDSFYTVTPVLANYRFNPSSRSFSLLGNLANAVFTGTIDSMSVRQNAIDSTEYFVRQQYLDFLEREPDQNGFNFWTNQIAQCNGDADCVLAKRVNVSAAFFLSIEFQETGGLIDGLYRVSFDRAPRYAEFTPDNAAIARDIVVGRTGWEQQMATNRQAFLDAYVERPEFRAAYEGLSNNSYVDQLLTHSRIIWTQDERNTLVGGLTNGTLTRAGVLGQIAGDQRFIAAKRNQMFVTMEYFGYLHRDPDASGYQFWLNKLNQFNGNFEQAEMVKAFILSTEYRQRFGL